MWRNRPKSLKHTPKIGSLPIDVQTGVCTTALLGSLFVVNFRQKLVFQKQMDARWLLAELG